MNRTSEKNKKNAVLHFNDSVSVMLAHQTTSLCHLRMSKDTERKRLPQDTSHNNYNMSDKKWFPDIPSVHLKPHYYDFSPLWTLLCLIKLLRKEKLL